MVLASTGGHHHALTVAKHAIIGSRDAATGRRTKVWSSRPRISVVFENYKELMRDYSLLGHNKPSTTTGDTLCCRWRYLQGVVTNRSRNRHPT